MNTKICTDIQQSKKLLELGININNADMHYMYRHWEIDEETVGSQSDASIGFDSDFYCGADNGKTYHYIPAWSLSALIKMLPEGFLLMDDQGESELGLYSVWVPGFNEPHFWKHNPVDAVFEMVCWLKKEKYI